MKTRTRLVLIALAGVVLALIYAGLRPGPLAVTLAPVMTAPLWVTIEEEGRTRIRERFDVSAPVAGYAPRVELHPGDPIQREQVLLELQPTPATALDARSYAEAEARADRARAALEAEQSRLRAAEARLDLARQEFERIEPLYRSGTVARREFDNTVAALKEAEAMLESVRHAVEVAGHELRAARATLQYGGRDRRDAAVPVISPVAGRLLAVHHESQGIVSPGELLMTVGDPASLEVVTDVLSEHAVRIAPGMRVLFERWGGDAPLEGRVRVVEPSGFTKISALGVEEQRVRVISDILSPFEEWKGLGDAYRVETIFVLEEGEDLLQVPASALFRHEGSDKVFRADDDRAVLTTVRVGRRGDKAVEILGGLNVGDRVIVHPDNEIEDGVLIEAIDDPRSDEGVESPQGG